MFKVTSTLQMVKLVALSKGMGKLADKAVDAAAAALAEDARSQTHQITGALAMSIGYVSPLHDTYTQRTNAASALNPRGETLPTPERPPGHSAVVAPGMAYGIYEELGTSRRPGHPYFTPAVERARQTFPQIAAKIVGEGLR